MYKEKKGYYKKKHNAEDYEKYDYLRVYYNF